MNELKDLPVITMTNTKKEMLDAYESAKRQLHEREKQTLDVEKTRKQTDKKASETIADTQASQDPIQRLYQLKVDLSRELTSLGEKIEAEIDAYRKIKVAVQDKQSDLKILYEIEAAASDLAALIEAQQEKKRTFEQEMEDRQNAVRDEIQTTKAGWEKEKKEREAAAKEQVELLKKQHQREKEDYDYYFSREKDQRKNALEDELKALENEISEKRNTFEQDLNRKTLELEIREKALSEKEVELARLQKEVETFPQKLNADIQKAVAAATERLNSDFEKTKALLEANHTGEKNLLISKIEFLEKLVRSQETQMADLGKRNDQAYEKVQDIANRAVSSAKREFVTIPLGSRKAQDQDES